MYMDEVFYKLEIHGIVYLVNTKTMTAHLYDVTSPTEIGKVIWDSIQEKPSIAFHSNWKQILQQKFDNAIAPQHTA